MKHAKQKIKEYRDALNKGVNISIKKATETMYNKIIENCSENNLGNYIGGIHWEYNENKNIGRIWADANDEFGFIIILNEFGTGLKQGGSYNYVYAKEHGYTINMSGKGEKGWAFPTKDGEFKWTHGIPSKLMFYNALQDMKNEFKGIVNIEINGTIGKVYTGESDK